MFMWLWVSQWYHVKVKLRVWKVLICPRCHWPDSWLWAYLQVACLTDDCRIFLLPSTSFYFKKKRQKIRTVKNKLNIALSGTRMALLCQRRVVLHMWMIFFWSQLLNHEFRIQPFIELVRSVIHCVNNRMVWKRKQRSLLLNNEQNKDYQSLLGFLVITCVFLAFIFFHGDELVEFQKYIQSVQTISYCGWQLFCVSDDRHSNTT